MRKLGLNYQTFTRRDVSSSEQAMYSQESRLTNQQINYSFQKDIQVPQFKQINQMEILSRANRQNDKKQNIQSRLFKLQILMNKLVHTSEMNLQISRQNQKRINNIEDNLEKIVSIIQYDKNDKQNNQRITNVELNKSRLSRMSELRTNKSQMLDTHQSTLAKKLSKTRSILTIQDRKKQIDREISVRLKEQSAKRNKVLNDLRKQSYTHKFF